MNRRRFIASSAAAVTVLGLHRPVFAARAEIEGIQRWLATLATPTAPKTTEGWPLSVVLDHLAQSIAMSMDGFPEPKSALFQNTVGTAAFAFFRLRGGMSHGLTEPIPGAPALTSRDWRLAVANLDAALARFDAHTGALKPHFAYGALAKADYALAHRFHCADHQKLIVLA